MGSRNYIEKVVLRMPVIFHEQEREYDIWLKRNPNGYVLNFCGGKESQAYKIHRVNCWKLTKGKEEMRTSVQKVCCDDLENLKTYANVLRGNPNSWTYCQHCLG
jgi:hypothetical protein